MKSFVAAAVVLAAIAGPALAQSATPHSTPRNAQSDQQQAILGEDEVMGQDVFSSDGQPIGSVVDTLLSPAGDLVAVAVVDPGNPEIGLALPAELLAMRDGRLTADITTAEIAALPDPEQPDDTPAPESIPDEKPTAEQ